VITPKPLKGDRKTDHEPVKPSNPEAQKAIRPGVREAMVWQTTFNFFESPHCTIRESFLMS
jgi:hypothetical protein